MSFTQYDINGDPYIIRGYYEELYGLIIPEQFTVRALNGRWQSSGRDIIGELATNGCPTYGLCQYCFGSGPTGMHCQICTIPDCQYMFVLYKQKMIEATWLSRLLETTHMDAWAHRTWTLKTIPVFRLTHYDVEIQIRKKYSSNYYINETLRESLFWEDLNHFDIGVEDPDPGIYDVLDRDKYVRRITPQIDV